MTQPSKIEDPALIQQLEKTSLASSKATQNSAWNKAGTWEDKKLKLEDLKQFLLSQAVIVGKHDQDRKLEVTDVKSISGEASVAVVRGQPRVGYELTLKVELTGVKDTYLEGMKCCVELQDFCDDGDLAACKIEMNSMLDTNQGT